MRDTSIACELGPLIGEGGTAEVYRFGETRAVKLFHLGIAPDSIDREATALHHAHKLGLPVPEILDQVVVNGRTGIVYRYISGDTMHAQLKRQPWRIISYARQFAEAHAQIHQATAAPIFAQTTRIAMRISAAPGLSEDTRERLKERLRELDGKERQLCHGDFHPINVLMTATGPVVIDWMASSAGDPAADVARTVMLLQVIAPIGKLSRIDRVVIAVGWRLFAKVYFDKYCRITGMARSRVEQWDPIVSAVRMNTGVSDEVEELHRRVKKI